MSTSSGSSSSDVFTAHRRRLFGVAYAMLGSVADADDIVQEAWLRWSADDRGDVHDPEAYLVRMTSRLALNRIRANKARREVYVGPWLPEPIVIGTEAADPGEVVAERDEREASVSMAMLVVLESLSPAERAVFVLREVFGMSHEEVAATLDRTPDAVRQLAHRARSHVQARRPRFVAEPEAHREITERFLLATVTGDLADLMSLLAPDVELIADGGGKRRAALRTVHGADKVARLMIGITQQSIETATAMLCTVNGSLGVAVTEANGDVSIGLLDVEDGQVTRVLLFRNPEKLGSVRTGAE